MLPTLQHDTPIPVPVTILDAASAFMRADRELTALYAQHAPADPPSGDVEAISTIWWNCRDLLVEMPATSGMTLRLKARALQAALTLAAAEQDDFAASLARDMIRFA